MSGSRLVPTALSAGLVSIGAAMTGVLCVVKLHASVKGNEPVGLGRVNTI